MKQNNKFYKNIIAIILSVFMLFSNIANTFAYEWDLQIPSIGGEDIIINGNDDLVLDDTVIIDTSPETSNNQNENVEIGTTNPNINIENNQNNGNDDLVLDDTVIIDTSPQIDNDNNQNGNIEIENKNPNINIGNNENKVNYDTTLLSEDFDKNNGLTVKVPIIASIPPITTKSGENQLTLVGSDKGADATVTFKGDESGATNHALIDYITRENNDPNAVSYCISPFYAGAKENGTTVVTIDSNVTENDK